MSPEILYSYRLRTPSKYQLNSAVIIGKIALIAADYEFVNFNAMKLRDAAEPIFDQDYSAENDAIKSAYRGTHNFKVGGELRIAKYFALRGGFNYRQAPYESEVALTDAQVITYTGGFGFRKHSFYLDVAASYSDQNQDYYMYQGVDPASLNTNRQRLMCTIGYRY